MKISRTSAFAARIFLVYVAVAVLAAFAIAGRALGATDTPLEKMSIDDRLTNAPDATVVHLGSLTTTLGALRAAHRAREAALAQADSLGSAAHGKLSSVGGPSIVGIGASRVPLGVSATAAPQPVIEPASQYASAPADMKAFCSAAAASACLYLPSAQEVVLIGNSVIEADPLVTKPQCAQEGGTWDTQFAGWCTYQYPSSVLVHFTPAANYKLTKSAHCDSSVFTYTVDDHGAILISWKTTNSQYVVLGADPTCIVTVTPGA
jgi:hypothetical protein